MWTNLQETADLVKFNGEILMEILMENFIFCAVTLSYHSSSQK